MIIPEVLLEESKSPARPQGRRPTCLAFAISDLNRPQSHVDLSPEYVYRAAAKATANWKPGDGITLEAAQIACRKGQPEETGFPYCAEEPPLPVPPIPVDLPLFGGAPELHSKDPTDLECTIRAGKAVGLGIRVTQEFYDAKAGVIEFSEGVLKGLLHAVVAVGVGRRAGEVTPWFYVRNSWGPSWGKHGYAWISGEYVVAHIAHAFGVDHGENSTQ